MSFFKQLLSDYVESSTRQQRPNQDQTAVRPISAGTCGLPIALTRIREALRDPDLDYNPYEPGDDDTAVCESMPSTSDVTQVASSVDHILQATRSYLETEIAKEQHDLDWTFEYKFEKVVLHPKGNELPQFSSAEELKQIVYANDLLIPVKAMGMAVDRAVMDRIQAGVGPRPAQYEDLIEKLRLKPKPRAALDQPLNLSETYDELLGVLRAWNMHVGGLVDQTRAREELLYALEARCQLIDAVETGKEYTASLRAQCELLRHALHAFRPELRDFENQDVFDQLVIMLANEGLANPRLDDEVRHLAVQTLFRDRRLRIFFSDEHTERRSRLDAELQRAKIQEDPTEEVELLNERKKLEKESFNQASEKVRTAIKLARRQLYNLNLKELQTLTEQQAGQKEAACSVERAPGKLLAQRCIDSNIYVEDMIRAWDVGIEDRLKAVEYSMQRMDRLDADNRRQARKLAGLDVSSADRKAVMERRRKDHRTALIMKEVEDQSSQVQDLSRSVLKRMETIRPRLNNALEAVNSSYVAHETLLARLDEDDSDDTGAIQ